ASCRRVRPSWHCMGATSPHSSKHLSRHGLYRIWPTSRGWSSHALLHITRQTLRRLLRSTKSWSAQAAQP
ncbi:hypothetical protein NLO76_27185, partial [Escherichia coli]|nr:hypothetical protein [Escherichia coli]